MSAKDREIWQVPLLSGDARGLAGVHGLVAVEAESVELPAAKQYARSEHDEEGVVCEYGAPGPKRRDYPSAVKPLRLSEGGGFAVHHSQFHRRHSITSPSLMSFP